MKKKLRLVLWEECNRSCEGCCNKDVDFTKMETVRSVTNYDLIMLTGGEPMLYPEKVMSICESIRRMTATPIIMYTAKVDDMESCVDVLPWLDGITVTLHEQGDVPLFMKFANRFHGRLQHMKLRLNIFDGIYLTAPFSGDWDIKDNIEWIKDAPLPEGETIQRLWL
ncbi:4Fe-4S cluster-binding domain-containing protein [Candidatus Pacearchaeota archaeon]|nr:4Fe-4S cluster-binding domain-containing protein [Candidatus Pacearchaeota archaeon]